MTDLVLERGATAPSLGRARSRRGAVLAATSALVLANAAVIVWLWIHGGNLHAKTTGAALTSAARLTGLLGAYLALIQVLLLARIPALERAVGFDRLSVWHRWNGHACLDFVLAHVVLSVYGYALTDRTSAAYARGDHVLDPHSRRAPAGVLSVTITGPELETADAYATAALAMGAPAAPHWTARLPRGYEAMTILEDDRVLTTPGFPSV